MQNWRENITSVYMPKKLREEIEREAKELNISKSDLIRMAISKYLKEESRKT